MVYEIGLHFVPSLPEEKIAEKYESLKDTLVKQGAEVISEESPELMDLAYEMTKHVAGKNIRYSTAYFSWVKFDLEAEKIAEVKNGLDADTEVLRYLIVKTVKENTLHGQKFASAEVRKSESRKAEKVEKTDKATEPEVKGDMDKAIDELITE